MTMHKINDVDLYVEDLGSGPAVVLVHGWGSSTRVWAAQQADLAVDHRVVAYDWRSAGRSGRTLSGNTIAGNAADLLSLCRQLSLEAPVLVGSSIGAAFATEAALVDPSAIGGVVAVDGPGHHGTALVDSLADVRAALRTDRAGAIASWVPGWYAPGAPSALVDWTIRQLLDSGPFIDELFADVSRWDPRPRLATTKVPFTYVHGRQDGQVPLAVAEELAALTPAARLVVTDAGHMPHQEQPAVVTAAIREMTGAGS